MEQTAVEWLVSNIDWMLVKNCNYQYKMIIKKAIEIERERTEHLIKALNVINQMSDCGSYETSIIRMKEVASNAIKQLECCDHDFFSLNQMYSKCRKCGIITE
jgi:hypothetical protein